MESQTKNCQNCKKDFIIESEDFDFYEKISVPPPTWCPECRMMRRFIWRSQRKFFRRKDSLTGKEIFSSFPPAAPVVAYETSYWNSDAWDPLDYGRDYDFSRSFFEQYRELLQTVPLPSRAIMNLVNSDYCNQGGDLKNSYLCFDADYLENSGYVVRALEVKDSFDLYEARHTELSYENYMVDESYRVFFSVNCEESADIWFSKNLVGCQNCFGSVNLRNKSYYIFNQPYSKEAYKEYIEKLNLGSHRLISELKEKAKKFWMQFPMKYTLTINNVNSWGEHVEHSKNVKESWSIHEAENLKYCQLAADKVSDSYDYTVWGNGASRMYESVACGQEVDSIRFSFDCWPSSRSLEYSVSCRSSSDLFGCVGLKKKQYCIFNKEYTREEYGALREKIIKQMNDTPYIDSKNRIYRYGEFFPLEFSPFAYNETLAYDLFPLTSSDAESMGYLWREEEMRQYVPTKTTNELDDDIKSVDDSIVQEIIACSSCPRSYRIIPMELAFYRRLNLPLPRFCPECRFTERFKQVNPPKFWDAKCQCAGEMDEKSIYKNAVTHAHGSGHCLNEFKTSYALGRPEIVYCESCYQSEVT